MKANEPVVEKPELSYCDCEKCECIDDDRGGSHMCDHCIEHAHVEAESQMEEEQ